MMIEQNTNYAYKLKYMDNLTFDKVRDLSTKFYRELPQALQDELFEALNRGIDILDSEPQMTAYLFAFGKMHQAKLNYAFGKLPQEFLEQPEINIIDYGCGQALGTMCYADFLREKGYSQKVKAITLIEPSETCLKRAALHASVFFPDAEIMTVNKKFDDLTQDDIVCNEETPTLHVLSNVLDMLNFDLDKFSTLIKDSLNGYNQFVCVGPYFNYSDKDDRINAFCSLLDGNANYSKVFDKYEFDPKKTWTAQILCISVSKDKEKKLSTVVTEEEILNGVEDEYGVVYSLDGNKLLKCKNTNLVNYTIKCGTTTICNKAFHQGALATSSIPIQNIIIPNTVRSIGESAFLGCRSLRQISIPNSVAYIGSYAFTCCSALEQINIPKSITSIGDCAFSNCTKLTLISESSRFYTQEGFLIDEQEKRILAYTGKDNSIRIPDSIKSIGRRAFSDCNSLQQITISNSVKNIEKEAFLLCGNLQNIIIPNSVISIGEKAFSHCKSLRQIVIPESTTKIEWGSFDGCESLQQISIPNTITCIGDYAFSWCRSLRQITIPNSVTVIGKNAFDGCESLRQITIPNLITKIEECTFRNCNSLQTINFLNTVNGFGWDVFGGCDSLRQIIIPQGASEKFKKMLEEKLCDKLLELPKEELISQVGPSQECENLSTEVTEEDLVNAVEDTFGVLYSKDGKKLLKCNNLELDFYDIKTGTRVICDKAFRLNRKIEEIFIPSSVIGIGENAFGGCWSLQQINIPSSITRIRAYTFSWCKSLQRINIPSSVTIIEEEAFSGCIALQIIDIPNSVTNVGNGAFSECVSVQQISISNSLSSINDKVFFRCKSLKQIIIPDSVNCICDWAFAQCESMEQIIFPNTLINIGCRAFWLCRSLIQITLPDSVTCIDSWAFSQCGSLKQVVIPISVTDIGFQVFWLCASLQQITIPSSIVFNVDFIKDCKSIPLIIIPKGSKRALKRKLNKELWNKLIEQ